MAKFDSRPEVVGYKVGAIPMHLVAGTSDEVETAQGVQGQPYALLRAWNPSALAYATLLTDVDGKLLVSSTGGGTGSGSTAVDASLTSAGSTRLVGQMTVANPTTSVSLAAGSSNNTIGAVAVLNGGAGSTAVDATLTSDGSTRLVGQVTIANPTTSVTLAAGSSNNTIGAVAVLNGAGGSTTVDANLSSVGSTKLVGQFTVANPTTAVTVSSGVVLGPSTAAIGLLSSGTQTIGTVLNASSTAQIGSIVLVPGSSANTVGAVALVAGTSANTLGSVALVGGSSANMIGAVAQSSGAIMGASTALVGLVAQGSGSSANAWYTQSIAFSSGNAARTTVNTSVDVQIIAANANRKALIVACLSTAQTVAIGLTTAVMTTALANVSLYVTANSYVLFGLSGGLPLYQGPIRAINITSTAVAGGVAVTEFT